MRRRGISHENMMYISLEHCLGVITFPDNMPNQSKLDFRKCILKSRMIFGGSTEAKMLVIERWNIEYMGGLELIPSSQGLITNRPVLEGVRGQS